ncbi:MAG: hypothetical protein G01um101420_700 [Parcubacteria group bacterium Gr01-1014_20]|nr:MAG: hypothetical protein G01um101420_700 [Parcubacteria group bacterium Gr01-1014_20]
MQKYIVSFLVLTLGFGAIAPAGVSAQTSTAQTQLQMINQLTQQILDLQNQIKALQKKSVELQVEQQGQVLELLKSLRQGSSGDDVTVLQVLLAADPNIYPEGLVTGYYGLLTSKAVMKFQAKHGIDQLGIVGPKTLKKLNEFLKENRLTKAEKAQHEDDDDDEDNDDGDDNDNSTRAIRKAGFCIIVPPGHLIAKGWLKKNDKPIVPICQVLPPGILKKIGPQPSSTPDTVAPTISSLAATSITISGATISWTTNEAATTKVYYSTSSPVTTSSTATESSLLVTGHSMSLTGLIASTTYYYMVESKDAVMNKVTSNQGSFTTATPAADTLPATISSIGVTNITVSGATVNWTTNEPAKSKVYFATSTPVGLTTATSVAMTAFVTSHSVALTGLNQFTNYYFLIETEDAAGNKTTSGENVLTTATPDITAPIVSAVNVSSLSSTSASIGWTTNELATSKVYYGTTSPLNLGVAAFVSSSGTFMTHLVNLTGLVASTTYHYIVESKDVAMNAGTSVEASFTTTP